MERILEMAKRKADKAEVFRIEKQSEPACFSGGELTTLESENSISTALRVIVDGHLGFSSTTHPDEAEGLVKRAVASAAFGPEIDLDFPSVVRNEGAGDFFDPRVADLTTENLIDTGQNMIDIVRSKYPEVNLEVEVTKEKSRTSIMNSSGGCVSYEKTIYQAFLNVLLMLESDRAELEHTCTYTTFSDAPEQIARDAVWRFSHCHRVAPVETKKMTVLFTSLGFRGLFVPLFYGFGGDLVYRKLSLLSGRLGESIVDPRITVVDDPTRRELPASCPFDDEGVSTGRNVLIDKGVLTGYMYDLRSAGKAGAKSSGNGFKKSSLYTGFSIDAQPNTNPSNLIILPGMIPKNDLIKDIREGIIVDDTMGAGQGNNMNGEFSMSVALGYKIENGEIVGRVKDVMVSGNVYESFKNNFKAASREVWTEDTLFGRYQVPWLVFEDMPVAAT
ncbi:TldD/PmbA family protein [bacterium]|nr:TldD/PmbA family protein [candidate division CSSED10-310 bacterium]